MCYFKVDNYLLFFFRLFFLSFAFIGCFGTSSIMFFLFSTSTSATVCGVTAATGTGGGIGGGLGVLSSSSTFLSFCSELSAFFLTLSKKIS